MKYLFIEIKKYHRSYWPTSKLKLVLITGCYPFNYLDNFDINLILSFRLNWLIYFKIHIK